MREAAFKGAEEVAIALTWQTEYTIEPRTETVGPVGVFINTTTNITDVTYLYTILL